MNYIVKKINIILLEYDKKTKKLIRYDKLFIFI